MSVPLALLLAATTGALSGATAHPAARPPCERPAVLMLSLDDPDQPIARRIHEGYLAELSRSVEHPVVYREFYDQVRFGDRTTYANDYLAWLHHKYKGVRIDVIVVTQQLLPAPNDRFSLYIRCYWAEPSVVDGTWTAPQVVVAR